MPVTSTTLSGTNVWRLSGNVNDAELKTAWAGLITNNRYLLGRTLYIDDTCSLNNVRGTYYIDSQNLGVILHLSRNKSNTIFRNWFFTQTVGLSVGSRSNFIRFTNGTTITNSVIDGIDMIGGGMMYAVVGNPGGGDPRFLNEMMFGSLDGTLVTSAAWTEQEIEPTSIGTIWKGLNFQKAAGYPILGSTTGTQRQVIYRSYFNAENATVRLVRAYYNNSLCYVSSTVRRQGATVTSNLFDTFGSNGSAVIMILNNWKDETWFGASKTTLPAANWNAGNRIIGGVMKKIKVEPDTLIRTYDSRSTLVSQKSTFSETTNDFLSGTDSTTASINGLAQFVCVGAIGTGSTLSITRYTGQKFTLQKFGWQVQVITPDMTTGDDDLSAFSPITMTTQLGITRTQAQIQAATTISDYKEVLEELHNLAVTQIGIGSYNGAYNGNLFELNGKTLETSFTEVRIDPSLLSKFSYNPTTNILSIKSNLISSTLDITEWRNATGVFVLTNSVINGVFSDLDGSRVLVSNLDPQNFGVTWNIRYKIIGTSTWTELTGTGNTATIILDLSEYTLQARVAGYAWKEIEFNTNENLSIDLALQYHEADDGTPQWLKPFNSSLVDIFEYDPVEMEVEVTNTTRAILQPGFPELYRVVEKVQQDPTLVWFWVNPVTTNSTSQKVLIPPSSPLRMYLSVDSDASVKITCPVVYSDTGISADDRVKGNPAGYSIILGSSATADSSLIVSQLVEQLGGPGFVTENHSLTKIKGKVDKTLTKTQFLGLD